MNIFNYASGELRDLVFGECRLVNEIIIRSILNMEDCFVKEYGLYVWNRFNAKIMDICGKLKELLIVRRRIKLDKLCDII